MVNLFSMLSEQQINSLTKEERDQLLAIDTKLFPNLENGGGEPGLHNQDWLKKKLADMNKQREEEETYEKMIEESFDTAGKVNNPRYF